MSNDKKVRDLVLKIPGNLECADCGDTGKAVIKFCSVKLGVFLCNQCYAAHRALGAHITRGKCIGLDSFTDQEVALLTNCGGNYTVNAKYEANLPPGAKPPPTPCNGCSLSTCRDCKQRLEFIRKKYEQKLWFNETAAAATPVQPIQQPQQQQQQSATATGNDDPFGLFSSKPTSASSAPSSSTKQPANPSDTDFFASFGL